MGYQSYVYFNYLESLSKVKCLRKVKEFIEILENLNYFLHNLNVE